MAENNPIDSIPVSEESTDTFVFSGQNGEIQIEFEEGLRTIPDYIIQAIGGAEKLKELAPALRELKFTDFVGEFEREMQRQALNNYQKRFVSNHFSKMR